MRNFRTVSEKEVFKSFFFFFPDLEREFESFFSFSE